MICSGRDDREWRVGGIPPGSCRCLRNADSSRWSEGQDFEVEALVVASGVVVRDGDWFLRLSGGVLFPGVETPGYFQGAPPGLVGKRRWSLVKSSLLVGLSGMTILFLWWLESAPRQGRGRNSLQGRLCCRRTRGPSTAQGGAPCSAQDDNFILRLGSSVVRRGGAYSSWSRGAPPGPTWASECLPLVVIWAS